MAEVEKKESSSPKKVVYLIGAGATQAEVGHKGGRPINLLMRDKVELGGDGINTRVLKKSDTYKKLYGSETTEKDIEQFISLLSATGLHEHQGLVKELRRLYFEEILSGLTDTGILTNPELAIGLLEMHGNTKYILTEKLTGIISLNHDNLFQIASQKVFGKVRLGFINNYYGKDIKDNSDTPIIIQLHGSFNWRNTAPITITDLVANKEYNDDILWIPPSIQKESKDYPYNKLMGLAHELLTTECDILRIVGFSLNQNDWNIVSLLFTSQQKQFFADQKRGFRIELIMRPSDCKKIEDNYSYLMDINSIGRLIPGRTDDYLDAHYEDTGALSNYFEYWLKHKVLDHSEKDQFDLDAIGLTLKDIVREEEAAK